MTEGGKLELVRAVHTVIYVVMAAATLATLFAGITGASGPWLWLALVLVGIESTVFVGNGFTCPFTAVVEKYGGVSDTYFPERVTRHTFQVFGPIILIAVVLLAVRWLRQ